MRFVRNQGINRNLIEIIYCFQNLRQISKIIFLNSYYIKLRNILTIFLSSKYLRVPIIFVKFNLHDKVYKLIKHNITLWYICITVYLIGILIIKHL